MLTRDEVTPPPPVAAVKNTKPAHPLNWVETLTVLAALPATAHLTSWEAGLYLRTTADVLRVWRSAGKGPRFKGRGHFVRYTKSDLDEFMGGFDHRFGTNASSAPE
jgi:hypothetical protein